MPLRRRHPPAPRLVAQGESPPQRNAGDLTADDLVTRAQSDPQFNRIAAHLQSAGVESWLTDRERAFLFGLGAYAPGDGVIVEIGSWKGASASLIAAGIRARGRGRLTCVDPHAGAPLWLGHAPFRSTRGAFEEAIRGAGVSDVIQVRFGDSFAVAASWPSEPIDGVLIDGDHSLLGALRDFEGWAPKLKGGGLVLIDDADQLALAGLLSLVEDLKRIEGITFLGAIDGMAVFIRDETDPWQMLDALRDRMADRGIHRSRDTSPLFEMELPATFLRSRTWEEPTIDTAYELCFLARCGAGPYAYSAGTHETDRELLRALSADRGDGDFTPLPAANCRVVLCTPEEVRSCADALQPAGVLLTLNDHGEAGRMIVHGSLLDAGLEGCGWEGRIHWGVREPHQLSPDTLVDRAFAALTERGSAAHLNGQLTSRASV